MVIAEERKESVLSSDVKKHKINAIKALEDYLAGHDISLYEIVKEINSQPRATRVKRCPLRKYHVPPWYFKESNMRACKKCGKVKPWTSRFFCSYPRDGKRYLTITCSKCIKRVSDFRAKNKKLANPKPKKPIGSDYYERYMYIINRMRISINKPDRDINREDIINYLSSLKNEYSEYYRKLIMAAVNYFIRNNKKFSTIRMVEFYVESV